MNQVNVYPNNDQSVNVILGKDNNNLKKLNMKNSNKSVEKIIKTCSKEKKKKINVTAILVILTIIVLILILAIIGYFVVKYLKEKYKLVSSAEIIKRRRMSSINFIGDSITYGKGLSNSLENRFTQLIEDYTGIKINNLGVDDSTIGKLYNQTQNIDFLTRMTELNKTANFTFIFGGTNDYKYGTPLGDINSNSNYSFYGALNILTNYLFQFWNNTQICFILPIYRFNETFKYNSGVLNDYRNVIIEISKKYNIDYINLNSIIPKPVFDNKSDTYYIDGINLNENGNKLVSKAIISYIDNMTYGFIGNSENKTL